MGGEYMCVDPPDIPAEYDITIPTLPLQYQVSLKLCSQKCGGVFGPLTGGEW